MDPVVHLEGAADDRRVPAELVHPVAVAQHEHRVGSRLILALAEGATEVRSHAEDVEEVGGNHAGLDPARLAVAQEDEGHRVILDDAFERSALRPIVAELGHREAGVLYPRERGGLLEKDEPLALAVRQRPQQHATDHAEDGGVGPDPERQREQRDERVAGAVLERANGVAEILGETHHRRSPRLGSDGPAGGAAAIGLDRRHVAEGLDRRGPRRSGAVPGFDQLPRSHVQVEFDLAVDVPGDVRQRGRQSEESAHWPGDHAGAASRAAVTARA